MSTVATVVIAYNEKALLELTLPPIKAVSDQVIIVDMGSTDGSHELYQQLLGPADMVVPYARENLFHFGFSHPRNYGAKFARTDWIFVVDCDEYLEVEATRDALSQLDGASADCFNLPRRNYIRTEPFHLGDLPGLLADCPFNEEAHRRLYRNQPRIRFEGVIHEEVWVEEVNAYHTSSPLPIVLHHFNQFKPEGNEHLKFGLYSYITLRAILYPGMRYGTNDWWFLEFPKQSFAAMIDAARYFTDINGLTAIDTEAVRAQLKSENVEV